MRISVRTPTQDGLGPVMRVLASWQQEGMPVQLHPGDLGWQWRFGPDTLADSLRVWSRDEEIVAVGSVDRDVPVDEVAVIRMALSPEVNQDEDVARVLVRDLEDPTGILRAGSAAVEARFGQALQSLLDAHGWLPDEPWTPLHRDLTQAVESGALRVETVGPSHVEERVAVQRAAFATSTFTVDRWHTMSKGLPYREARCLVGYDDDGVAVAGVTAWSAGPGRQGLLEPMGVHRDHVGRGHGTSITLAAAAALREMGSSSAIVATPASNKGGVATYAAAGFAPAPDVTDFLRPA
ncbi:acetyltransferase [Nocardioides sp. Soil777]|uniref:GNAT family N-acetyltransferase n=1 Tax=Nocardioides sp. Soil777 TaxID=1736409 RepID=UPI000702D7C2|nr:GNAT family N-acetyltransferase [Nocardioides sp. Soil777]KRF06696.1 acetyltransferase [Nocardioides sp. Soil777]